MALIEEKDELEQLKIELNELDIKYKDLSKKNREIQKEINNLTNKKNIISKKIKKLEDIIESENLFSSVDKLESFDLLTKLELVEISKGIDKTDYRKFGNFPRWIDLEKVIKEVIEFKKQYPGWILDKIEKKGQLDTLPPKTYYKYTYKTPLGHYLTYGGIEIIDN